MSMMQIATAQHTTHARVLYWLKKHGIQRRSWSESTYVKRNPSGDPFALLTDLSAEQQRLLLSGLMLYWGEGRKGSGKIEIANLDVRVLQVFVKFLRQVCRVNEARLGLSVLLHRSFDRAGAQQYWAEELGLPVSNVKVYHHLDERSKPRAQWSPYGIATLGFHNVKLKQWLMNSMETQIQELLAEDSTGSHNGHGLIQEATPAYLVN